MSGKTITNPYAMMRTELPATDALQKLFRLIHELCEMGDDAHAWRARLLTDVRSMIDADVGIAYVLKFPFDAGEIGPRVLLKIFQQLDDTWDRYVEMGDLSRDPATPHIMRRIGTDFTFARQEIIRDEDWYASAFYREVASAANWDQIIYSQVAIAPPGVVSGLGIGRAVGKPAFGAREVGIVRFVHAELAYLWRRPGPVDINTLPKRQREVLDGIRRGEPRKAIAEKMQLTSNTVHGYEKELFLRADVKSRGELLARLATHVQPNLLP